MIVSLQISFSIFIGKLILTKRDSNIIKCDFASVYIVETQFQLSGEFVTLTDLQSSRRIDSCWMDYGVHVRSDLGPRRQHRFEKPEAAGTSPETWVGYRRYDVLIIWLSRVAERSDRRKCKWNCIKVQRVCEKDIKKLYVRTKLF